MGIKINEHHTTGFHPENRYAPPYDMKFLADKLPDLLPYIMHSEGSQTIDFGNSQAVYYLNKALLVAHTRLRHWDVSENHLIPGVPVRAEYIYRMSDFIKANGGDNSMQVLDIGTGANVVYPIIGQSARRWKFIASEADPDSFRIADAIVRFNQLEKKIRLEFQSDRSKYFENIIDEKSDLSFSMCNPPFHQSAEEAASENNRKQQNLKQKVGRLNFSGTDSELWTKGGEKGFILGMINESKKFGKQVRFFSSLVSDSKNLPTLVGSLTKYQASQIDIIHMDHGNKKSRILIWTWQNF